MSAPQSSKLICETCKAEVNKASSFSMRTFTFCCRKCIRAFQKDVVLKDAESNARKDEKTYSVYHSGGGVM